MIQITKGLITLVIKGIGLLFITKSHALIQIVITTNHNIMDKEEQIKQYSETAKTIHNLIERGQYTTIKRYIRIYSIGYLIEVYRVLSNEDKDALHRAVENNLI
jgi:hypothetical protein